MAVTLNPNRPGASFTLARGLLFAVVVVALVSLHTYHFSGRTYRQDEVWPINIGMKMTIPEVVKWSSGIIHPPGWRVAIDVWVDLFGHTEPVTRFMSTLYTALTLAFTYRLAKDLFDHRTAVLAVILLGTNLFFLFYTHEVRPYPALAAGAAGTQIAFMRWMVKPNGRRALLFVLFGIGLVYTHFYGLIFLAALALCFVLLVRPTKHLYVRAFGLFAAVGLSFTAWLLPFLHSFIVAVPGGIDYGVSRETDVIQASLRLTYASHQINPTPLGTLLLIVGLMTPVLPFLPAASPVFRLGTSWRKLYPLLIVGIVLIIAFTSDSLVGNLTLRNLIVILPAAAIFLAFALRSLTWQAQVGAVLLVTIPALIAFNPFSLTGTQHEVIDYIEDRYQPGDRFAFSSNTFSPQVVLLYYFRYRSEVPIRNEDIFALTASQDYAIDNAPEQFTHLANSNTPQDLEQFRLFLRGVDRLWFITAGSRPFIFTDVYKEVLSSEFASVLPEMTWNQSDGYPAEPSRLTEYRRKPDPLSDQYNFGEDFALLAWTLHSDVNVHPCQSIEVESWWRAERTPDIHYSMTLVMANSSGIGVANTDSSPAGLLTPLWQPEQVYVDARTLTVPCDATPGEYPLLLGLYETETIQPLPVTFPDGTPLGDQLYLTTLYVQ